MEFWLKVERNDGMELNTNQVFQLPVNPATLEKTVGTNNATFNVEGLGEITFIGKKKLATITIGSFFPSQNYSFCVCIPKDDPWDYIWCIENWMNLQETVRLIITGTNINMLCSIENFSYKEVAGSRDIEYTLELKEYRVVS